MTRWVWERAASILWRKQDLPGDDAVADWLQDEIERLGTTGHMLSEHVMEIALVSNYG